MLSLQTPLDKDEESHFTFVIDDFTDYHHVNDFKSEEARKMFTDWQTKCVTLEKQAKQLEERRTRYTQSSKEERIKMTEELLLMEQQYEQLETEVAGMERAIRNTEIRFRGGK